MATPGFEIFEFAARAANFVAVEKNSAAAHNDKVTMLFQHALDSWKQNTLINRKIGKPVHPAPEVPFLHEIDEDKAVECFKEWWEHPEFVPGLPIRQDFVIKTPLPVEPNAFDLGPAPVPVPDDVVGGPCGDGEWFSKAGDPTPIGKVITHPVHGRIVKVRNWRNPFNPNDAIWKRA
jgi:hypothetical protein